MKYLSIDLGATSGRFMLSDGKNLCEVYRFKNYIESDGTWNIERIINEIQIGLSRSFLIASTIKLISIDTWGVDFFDVNNDQKFIKSYRHDNNFQQYTEKLDLDKLPYHLSSPTQTIARIALEHADVMLGTVEVIKHQRDRIVDRLTELGARPVASDSNFVLFGGLRDEKATWDALLDEGVLVRDMGIAHHLRVTAGDPHETTAFLEAMTRLAPAHVLPSSADRQEPPA